ncbi:hypothetical protein M406DRAFT_325212 [Cryphonectria parasitica EP155]|uniref:Uncharacterized protein n=1 Tax=Cryphonectria parasitica (strain ATCC 38755 / EP155) TaxID=660469 RepID=A0A9P4YBP7_CRYP1|nr:uncharacterized protein M406DRAFT_325212 [Cryphonectria parasitica EP155]KAF3769725.1 hypothetical protein M406DRAFT_325212 [Cryphonectria parasitica EP155]
MMKYFALISALAATAYGVAYHCETSCNDNDNSILADCSTAQLDIPTTDSASGTDNTNWISDTCRIDFFPNGESVDYSVLSEYAENLLNKCCGEGTDGEAACAGIAQDDGDPMTLGGGCICVHNKSVAPCDCAAAETDNFINCT